MREWSDHSALSEAPANTTCTVVVCPKPLDAFLTSTHRPPPPSHGEVIVDSGCSGAFITKGREMRRAEAKYAEFVSQSGRPAAIAGAALRPPNCVFGNWRTGEVCSFSFDYEKFHTLLEGPEYHKVAVRLPLLYKRAYRTAGGGKAVSAVYHSLESVRGQPVIFDVVDSDAHDVPALVGWAHMKELLKEKEWHHRRCRSAACIAGRQNRPSPTSAATSG